MDRSFTHAVIENAECRQTLQCLMGTQQKPNILSAYQKSKNKILLISNL